VNCNSAQVTDSANPLHRKFTPQFMCFALKPSTVPYLALVPFDWNVRRFMSLPTQYRLYGRRFLGQKHNVLCSC